MADPLAVTPPPPPAPNGRRRTKELAEHGLPHDIISARKRVQRSRIARSKKPAKVPRRTLGISLPGPVAEAVELIAERYEVAISAVQRRMIEDGVRRYGSPEEIDHAGLGEKKKNPFDPMDTQVQETPYDRYRERQNGGAYSDHSPEHTPPQHTPVAFKMPGAFVGQSIPTDSSFYEGDEE